jgi:polyhydroxyalkanoate synthesis regulator phasin
LTGEANYTAEEQYNKLVEWGYEKYMKYDSSGNEIKQEGDNWQNTAIQAFWDKIDSDKEEMQSLHDSVEELKNNVESNV